MSQIILDIVDASFQHVVAPQLAVCDAAGKALDLGRDSEGHWLAWAEAGEVLSIEIRADGYETLRHTLTPRGEVTQSVLGLGRKGELHYTQGDSRLAFRPRDDVFLARVRGSGAAKALKAAADRMKLPMHAVAPRSAADDDQFVRVQGRADAARRLALALSRARLDVELLLSIEHGDRQPLGLSGELVVRFAGDVRRQEADRLAAAVALKIVRPLLHAGNAFVLRGGELDHGILAAADALSRSGRVEYVEPNLSFALESDAYTPNDTLWAQLPHLTLTDTDDAWDLLDNNVIALRGGSPAITIGVVDLDGVSPDHPEFTAALTDGTAKLVSSTNFVANPIAPQTVAGLSGDHGTQCAGSATAAFDNNRGIAGVAPNCHLIGARIGGAANSVAMIDLYLWLAGFFNGSTAAGFPAALPARPADIISSSWGSNGLALSNTVRDGFDFLTTYGRAGKGTLLCFSLGNTGHLDFTNAAGAFHRAWPTYERTIAVGASIGANPTNPVANSVHADPNGNTVNIATAVDRRTLYSPFGATALRKPDLVAPSHTAYGPALVDPVMAAVRIGTGAVDGCPGAPVCNDYAQTFGGTSHSTPMVAGAIALILSARPLLNWVQVRDILRASCVRIDAAQAHAIGAWQDLDGDGQIDYSRWYGAGRLDVDAAVGLALDDARPLADAFVRENLADTGDVPSGGNWWASPDIWVSQDAAAALPALAWGSAPPHQNARRGQDNAVFCRVRNRGTAVASSVWLRALLTHWAGLEFVYPQDFEPSTNVGTALPNPLLPGTYLIGQTRIDNLAAGADQIVKFNWPQALIPPEFVTVGMANVRWHPCLLVEASPHDGPAPAGGTPAPVQGNNNIAQRNITIVEAGDSDSDLYVGMIAGTRSEVGIATLVIDARRLRGAGSVLLHLPDDELMKQLWAAVQVEERTANMRPVPGPGTGVGESGGKGEDADSDCAVIVETRTRLRVKCGDGHVLIEAAPGTRVLGRCGSSTGFKARWIRHRGVDAVELQGLAGQIEIPLRLAGGRFLPMGVAASGPAVGELRITQRRGDGRVSAGYGVEFRA